MPDVVFDGRLSAVELWGGSGSVHHKDQQAFKLYKARIKKWLGLNYLGIPKQGKLKGTREERGKKGF